MQILIGERYYYLGQYEESAKHLRSLLGTQLKSLSDNQLTRRQQLGILYLLARIEILQGSYESAAKKLKKVTRFGNKLWIAEEAGRLLCQKELEAYQ
jgi:tetratricopeptide (TPR) repeat protein